MTRSFMRGAFLLIILLSSRASPHHSPSPQSSKACHEHQVEYMRRPSRSVALTRWHAAMMRLVELRFIEHLMLSCDLLTAGANGLFCIASEKVPCAFHPRQVLACLRGVHVRHGVRRGVRRGVTTSRVAVARLGRPTVTTGQQRRGVLRALAPDAMVGVIVRPSSPSRRVVVSMDLIGCHLSRQSSRSGGQSHGRPDFHGARWEMSIDHWGSLGLVRPRWFHRSKSLWGSHWVPSLIGALIGCHLSLGLSLDAIARWGSHWVPSL